MINQKIFDMLVSGINSKLRIMEQLGEPITNDIIAARVDEVATEFDGRPGFDFGEEDAERLKFHIGTMFNVKVGEAAIALRNPDLPRWFHTKKSQIRWDHWDAYEQMLASQGRSNEIVEANEEVIDTILDYSGDPTTPGTWARKGLVMGNVQSGKTQNYIGLINKAIDCGYKTIILLGGHLNDLRRQTQERVDEGVLGRPSKHLAVAQTVPAAPIGVGIYRDNSVNSGTTTVGDFTKSFADKLGFKLSGEDPVIFTIKKHTGVMERLYDYIKDLHYLDPESGKKLDGPLLLIDDEADYASINTKHHKDEVTKTNDFIRKLLSLFRRNTYVGYTATPFANIFIDPDESAYSEEDDLFPSDFMVKMPVPDNYLGQDYYFGAGLRESDSDADDSESPTVVIRDHWPIYERKKDDDISVLPESLKDAIRAFLLVVAIRSLRGDGYSHNTMLVNISHLKVHQNQLEYLIGEYFRDLEEAINSFAGLGVEAARDSNVLKSMETTFAKRFSITEKYSDVFSKLQEAAGRIKVWAINQSNRQSDGKVLDYSIHKEHGLSVIAIGGHKLSRGLTLEGLSISYFARNSKAYDTLMQMCRWFGYRPNYADLCKVYLPEESLEWYAFITAAIRELYMELELMSMREQRPKEFGLKVREHPGAMVITAKNKMGAAESEVRSQDLWGQVQRRFRFRKEADINAKNLSYSRQFIRELAEDRENTKNVTVDKASGAWLLHDVDYAEISRFIRAMKLPEDDLGDDALVRHLKSMERSGLPKPKVLVFNQARSGTPKWESALTESERQFINTPYKFIEGLDIRLAKRRMDRTHEEYRVKSVHLGNPDDEKLFLSPAQRESVRALVKRDPISFDYMCSDARDFAGLMIYLFAVAVPGDANNGGKDGRNYVLGHGKQPTIGYTVSIPRSDSLKGMSKKEIDALIKTTKHSYQVNKIHSRLQQISAYEELDDEDEA